jgi:surface carbohydrate biosynthesis protein
MRIGVVLDNPKRDLNGVVLVANHIARAGHEALIVPMYQQGYDVPILGLDALVVNYARPNNAALLRSYRHLGVAVVVMDTEGGVLSESGSDAPDTWARSFRARGLHACVDRYLFWGERMHQAFVRDSGLPAERLVITGCPRYDLCSPIWRGLLTYPRSGYILVNTNFSALNPAFSGSVDAEIGMFERAGWDRAYTEYLFAELKEVYPKYLDSIESMACADRSRLLLLRPHPFENAQFYRQRFAGVPNVVVDADGDVLHVISNADCVVHLNCGTAVETLLLGKTAISLEFLNSDRMRRHAPLPSQISCAASSEEHLQRLIRDPGSRPSTETRMELFARFVRPYFHDIDGQAALRVAQHAIAAAAERTRPRRRSLLCAACGGVQRPRTGQLLQGLASIAAGSLAVSRWRERASPARAAKAVDAEDVKATLTRLHAVAEVSPQLTITQAQHPYTAAQLASISVSAEAR